MSRLVLGRTPATRPDTRALERHREQVARDELAREREEAAAVAFVARHVPAEHVGTVLDALGLDCAPTHGDCCEGHS